MAGDGVATAGEGARVEVGLAVGRSIALEAVLAVGVEPPHAATTRSIAMPTARATPPGARPDDRRCASTAARPELPSLDPKLPRPITQRYAAVGLPDQDVPSMRRDDDRLRYRQTVMKAAIQERYGSPDVVELREVDRPVASADQVLVRVRAASVNRADLDGIKPRPSFVRLFIGLRAPRNHRVGIDVAGVVESVGPDVTKFKPGDEVFADLYAFGVGAFAEYACTTEKAFRSMPSGMSFEEAAALPHSAILALQSLRLRNGRTIRPGDNVLIDGASGNVGPYAVQIAKSMGAAVTGVCSTEKVEFVRSLGADHVIDYTKVDYTTTGERYDWIVDTDSHHSILRVRRALRPKGVYVTLGGTSVPILMGLVVGPLISLASDKWTGLLLWWKPFNADDVATLKELIAAGSVKPVIDRRFPLEEVVEALRWVDDGRAKGKVVITVS
jgi:NADPH:quinone reductase-like Zn-dependent oxidoreductase